MTALQHYIELSSDYERPRPPASVDNSAGAAAEPSVDKARPRASSAPVARHQSTESGVFMSRPSSDTSPARSARRCASSHLSSSGYLRPTSAMPPATDAACQQLAAVSDSDLCGSIESDVFELDTLLPQ